MDIEQQSQSAFAPISPSFASQILKEKILLEGLFTESPKAPYNIVLNLTKNHIIAKSSNTEQSDKIYAAEINFDLKFETLYIEDVISLFYFRKMYIRKKLDLSS
jgi:hypothetical protein